MYAQRALKFPWHAADFCSSRVISTFPQQTLAQHQHRYGLARYMAVAVERLEVEAYMTPPKPCHMGIDQGFR